MNHASSTSKSPRWLWHILVTGTVLSIIAIGSAVWLLKSGIADPPRAANLIWTDDEFKWLDQNNPLSIDPNQSYSFTAPHPLSNHAFSLEIVARIEATSNDWITWGIWLPTIDNNWLIIAINASQFVTARRCPPNFDGRLETCQPLIEPTQQIRTVWKSFHHLHPSGQINHIHLDYLPTVWADGLTLRLNDEWMWDIPYNPPDTNLQWGIWVHSGPESSASIHWINAQIWQD